MRDKLAYLGSIMAILGILATVLDLFNRVPRVLFWIYNWGNGTAWIIKIGLIVAGGLLYWLAPSSSENEQEATAVKL